MRCLVVEQRLFDGVGRSDRLTQALTFALPIEPALRHKTTAIVLG